MMCGFVRLYVMSATIATVGRLPLLAPALLENELVCSRRVVSTIVLDNVQLADVRVYGVAV